MAGLLNFHEADALGGLMGGNQMRIGEDTARINQANVLEQIAASVQKRDHEAQMAPLKMEEARIGNLDKQSQIGYRDQQTAASKAQVSREQATAFVKAVIQQGDTPGAEDELAKFYGVQGHPVQEALRRAKKFDAENAGLYGPGETPSQSKTQMLLEALAQNDDTSRQAAAKDKAAGDRTAATNARHIQETQMQTESRERVARIGALARERAAEIQAKAAALKMPNMNQYAVELYQKATMAATPEESKMYLDRMNQITSVMERIAGARNVQEKQLLGQQLSRLTDGKVTMPIESPVQQPQVVPGKGPATTAPGASAAPPSTLKLGSGRNVTITQNGGSAAPGPQVLPVQPITQRTLGPAPAQGTGGYPQMGAGNAPPVPHDQRTYPVAGEQEVYNSPEPVADQAARLQNNMRALAEEMMGAEKRFGRNSDQYRTLQAELQRLTNELTSLQR